MRLEDLLPSKDDPMVLSLCERICPGQKPFYVPVRPESQFWMIQCFPNVAEKVRVAGGRMIHGWEISQIPKVHLEARFHAIWQSPAGEFVDVTPEELGQPRVLFLRDDSRTFIESRINNGYFI